MGVADMRMRLLLMVAANRLFASPCAFLFSYHLDGDRRNLYQFSLLCPSQSLG